MTDARAGGGDFASALYLGMRHPWAALGPWDALTTGVPAVLDEPPGAERTARRLARLQGLEAAVLLPSTLHLFHDLFALLRRDACAVLVDAGAYAVAREAAVRARIPARGFAHHDPRALRRALGTVRGPGRPVVLCDGICPRCGRVAPLPAYLAAVREAGGWLVVDDTQALGIVGSRPGAAAPYGRGGGGTPRWWGIEAPELVVGASLAKAFGAPLAALSGAAGLVDRFREGAAARVHSSPPSVAAVRAAARALALNRARGDALRARLADPAAAHAALAARGIRAVLRAAPAPRLTLLLRADHSDDELARVAGILAREAEPGERRPRCGTIKMHRTRT